jgi:hypothetical protein
VSIDLVNREVRRFLSSTDPEVICISGHWGVGKTFAWKRHVHDAQKESRIGLKRYSYVSLFGVNSLDDLKYSIFENTVAASDIGIEPSLETFQSNTSAAATRLGKKSLWFIQQLPFVKNYVGGLGPVWFLTVKDTIICLDDFERRGTGLSTREILGLVSNLKEQKGCKLALILNDDALGADREEFRRYYEKVVDVSLKYAPSPAECADIALSHNCKASSLLASDCVALGISNIRLIKRIERSANDIATILAGFNEHILTEAVHSLALLGWSVYEPDRAPSVDFLRKQSIAGVLDKKEESVSDQESNWSSLLRAYAFNQFDHFEEVLLEGITNGFFDPCEVKSCAASIEDQDKASQLNGAFWESWERFHDSFDNNQDEVLDDMYTSFLNGAQHISPMNMNSTVILFKALGRQMQAADMIRVYVARRSSERELFKPGAYPFFGETPDPDVTKAFEGQFAKYYEDKTDASKTLQRMATTNGWSPEDMVQLSSLPVDEYYRLFKTLKGDELRKAINTCLQFDRISNATPEMKEISMRAREALQQIGSESPMNARRVKSFGVDPAPAQSLSDTAD